MDPNNQNPTPPTTAMPNPTQPAPIQSGSEAAPLAPPAASAPSQTAVPQVHRVEGGSSGASSKMIFVFVGVAMVLAVLGGVYFYISQSQKGGTAIEQAAKIDTTEIEKLQTETNQMDLGDIQSDFRSVDTDLQSL